MKLKVCPKFAFTSHAPAASATGANSSTPASAAGSIDGSPPNPENIDSSLGATSRGSRPGRKKILDNKKKEKDKKVKEKTKVEATGKKEAAKNKRSPNTMNAVSRLLHISNKKAKETKLNRKAFLTAQATNFAKDQNNNAQAAEFGNMLFEMAQRR